MSDTNRVSLRYDEETTYGTAPTGSGIYTDLRFTSESLHQETTTTSSAEIRSDRQIPDIIRTQVNASGDVNWEFSYGTYDWAFEAALLSAGWSSPVTVGPGTTFSVTSGANQYTISDSAAGFGSINVGQWVRITGFASAANNGYAKVLTAAAGSIVVVGNGNGVTVAAGASVTIVQGGQIVNGTTFSSFTIEKEFEDIAGGAFEYFDGMAIDGMSISVPADGLVTGSFTFIGQNGTTSNVSLDTGTPIAPNSNEIMSSVDNVLKIMIGTSYIVTDATSFSLTLANNLRQRINIGDLGPSSLGTGSVNVSGQLQRYLEAITQISDYHSFLDSAIAAVFVDSAGNAYVLDVMRVNFTNGQMAAGGLNQDVLADLSWEASRHGTQGVTIRIARFAA